MKSIWIEFFFVYLISNNFRKKFHKIQQEFCLEENHVHETITFDPIVRTEVGTASPLLVLELFELVLLLLVTLVVFAVLLSLLLLFWIDDFLLLLICEWWVWWWLRWCDWWWLLLPVELRLLSLEDNGLLSSIHLSCDRLRAFMKKLPTVDSSRPSCCEMVICISLDGRLVSLKIACNVRRCRSVKTNRGFLFWLLEVLLLLLATVLLAMIVPVPEPFNVWFGDRNARGWWLPINEACFKLLPSPIDDWVETDCEQFETIDPFVIINEQDCCSSFRLQAIRNGQWEEEKNRINKKKNKIISKKKRRIIIIDFFRFFRKW